MPPNNGSLSISTVPSQTIVARPEAHKNRDQSLGDCASVKVADSQPIRTVAEPQPPFDLRQYLELEKQYGEDSNTAWSILTEIDEQIDNDSSKEEVQDLVNITIARLLSLVETQDQSNQITNLTNQLPHNQQILTKIDPKIDNDSPKEEVQDLKDTITARLFSLVETEDQSNQITNLITQLPHNQQILTEIDNQIANCPKEEVQDLINIITVLLLSLETQDARCNQTPPPLDQPIVKPIEESNSKKSTDRPDPDTINAILNYNSRALDGGDAAVHVCANALSIPIHIKETNRIDDGSSPVCLDSYFSNNRETNIDQTIDDKAFLHNRPIELILEHVEYTNQDQAAISHYMNVIVDGQGKRTPNRNIPSDGKCLYNSIANALNIQNESMGNSFRYTYDNIYTMVKDELYKNYRYYASFIITEA